MSQEGTREWYLVGDYGQSGIGANSKHVVHGVVRARPLELMQGSFTI